MEVIEDNKFTEFKKLIKENRKLATLALKTNAVTPNRVIKVKTDKWRAIIDEKFRLTKNNKFYLKRTKTHEIVIGKKYLYFKNDYNRTLKTISPFRDDWDFGGLITTDEIFEYYKLDFLKKHKIYLYEATLSFIKKNKITNFEKYFKLKYKYIPYGLFKHIVLLNKLDFNFIKQLNRILSLSKNPNVVSNYSYKEIMALMNNHMMGDLISMSSMLDRKINLLWSKKRIKLEHDKLSKEIKEIKKHFIDDEKYKINSKFFNIFPDTYELIDSKIRLFEEGENMKHCVFSSDQYGYNISNGTSAIYSTIYKKERYTIELSYSNIDKEISLRQIQGFSNGIGVPNKLRNNILEFIEKRNLRLSVNERTNITTVDQEHFFV